jgi:DNA-binding IclR family transcriptional regulator
MRVATDSRDMGSDTDRTLQTTETSLEVVKFLNERDGATVSEVAEALDKPPSTVHGHLTTLKEQEFVIQNGDNYDLSLRFITLGKAVRNRKQLYTLSDRYTQRVVEETDFRSIFAVEEHGRGVYLSRNAGDHSKWRHEQTGERFYLHATAAGKVLLAHLPEQRVDEIIDRWGLPALTENTITTREELDRQLEAVRDRGVAYNHEEQIEGIRAVSAPVDDPSIEGVGALSANGPAHRLADQDVEENLSKTLQALTNEFRLDLKLSADE